MSSNGGESGILARIKRRWCRGFVAQLLWPRIKGANGNARTTGARSTGNRSTVLWEIRLASPVVKKFNIRIDVRGRRGCSRLCASIGGFAPFFASLFVPFLSIHLSPCRRRQLLVLCQIILYRAFLALASMRVKLIFLRWKFGWHRALNIEVKKGTKIQETLAFRRLITNVQN